MVKSGSDRQHYNISLSAIDRYDSSLRNKNVGTTINGSKITNISVESSGIEITFDKTNVDLSNNPIILKWGV